MKESTKGYYNPLLLAALAACGCWVISSPLSAQTFRTLHSFTSSSTGGGPQGRVVLSGNTLYGTTFGGGTFGSGTVFAINTDGTTFRTVHNFTATDYNNANSDGCEPYGGLVLSGNTLYGTTYIGGRSGYGTVFAVNTDGTGFKNLHSFSGGLDGRSLQAGLVLGGTTLFGTTGNGGTFDNGTVFAITTNGTGFQTLYSFTPTSHPGPAINDDGANPRAGLVLSGSTLYGTTYQGGSGGVGALFAINTDGTGFTPLYSFTAPAVYGPGQPNSDGEYPEAGLVLSGNTLYGTARNGGSSGEGTVFALNTDGTGFVVVHNFTWSSSDGRLPSADLILNGGTLYGTTPGGGTSDTGTAFALNTDGSGFEILHTFSQPGNGGTNSDGWSVAAGLTLSGTTFYGAASHGGAFADGTLFSISLAPPLTMAPVGANVVLTWPTNVAGFDYTGYTLQSTTNLGPSAVWVTNSVAPTLVNGQFTVTNSIYGTQHFFRLSR